MQQNMRKSAGAGRSRHLIEALERRVLLSSYVVSTATDISDGNYGAGELSLREAVLLANATWEADTIQFALPAGAKITLSGAALVVNWPVTIEGPGADLLTIDGNKAGGRVGRIFYINKWGSLTLSGLTLSGGKADTVSDDFAGAILNVGALSADGVTFRDNSAHRGGGAIYNGTYNTMTISRSTFVGNSAVYGGAIDNAGTAIVSDTTFTGNSGEEGGAIRNNEGTVTVSNSTFTGNLAGNAAGAINNYQGTLTISDSTFTGNSAKYIGGYLVHDTSGGAIGNDGTATISNSTFVDNSATYGGAIATYGGGIDLAGTLTVSDSKFVGNLADYGGAINNTYTEGKATIIRSAFTGNSAKYGGAIVNYYYSTATVTNSTFASNTATYVGGVIYNWSFATAVFSNSTFTGNSAIQNGGAVHNESGSTVMVDNSILWGNSVTQSGGQIFGTVSIRYSDVQGGWTGEGNLNTDPLFVRMPSPGPDRKWGTADDDYGDLRLNFTSPAIDVGDNTLVPAGVETDITGAPRISDVPGVGYGLPAVVDLGAYEARAYLYVDAAATGRNNGSSWADAYTDLQAALGAAVPGRMTGQIPDTRIYVAAGTYRPTQGTDRSASFQLKNGVNLYGGYAGASQPGVQDIDLYPTILSGDIGVPGDSRDNSYHVVQAIDVLNATLSGMTITGGVGQANVGSQGYGGGVYLYYSMARFINMRLECNRSPGNGGAVYAGLVVESEFSNCIFVGNTAAGDGGALYADSSAHPLVRNSVFFANSAARGGAVAVYQAAVSLTNNILWGNTASAGATWNNVFVTDTSAVVYLSYSDVQGGYLGTGNIYANPRFIRNPSSGSDGVWGTGDDDWGDLRLQMTSPAIDAGNSSASVSIQLDYLGHSRFVDVESVPNTGKTDGLPPIDMGPYEMPDPAPRVPFNLRVAQVTSSNELTLYWDDRSTDETGFTLEQATDAGFSANFKAIALPVNTAQHTATGLAAGTTYYFRVKANGAVMDSPYSNVASGTTQGAVLSNLALNRPVVASSTEVAWTAASNVNDGKGNTRWASAYSDPQWVYVDLGQSYDISRVVLKWEDARASEYQIQVSSDAANWSTIKSVSNSAGGVQDWTGLSGVGRYVRMLGTQRATTYGYSLWEMEVYGSSGPAPVLPAAPSGLAAVAIDSGRIDLSWSDNASNETGFTLEWATDPAFSQNRLSTTVAANNQAATLSGLSAGTSYYFRLRAVNGSGVSAWSNVASAATPGDTTGVNLALNRPAVASSVEASWMPAANVNDGKANTRWASGYSDNQWVYVDLGQSQAIGRVVLTWEAAYGKDFQIQVSDDAATWTTIQSVSGNTSLTNDLGGLSGTGRYVRMLGTKRATTYGYSLWEMEVYGSSGPAPVIPAAPSSLAASALGATQVQLTWADNANNETGFEIQRATDAGFTQDLVTTNASANATQSLASGLSPATTYYFRLRALNGASASAWSNTASATTSGVVSGNLALNRPTVASSVEVTKFVAANATDGQSTTRWASGYSDNQWVYVDLGQSQAIGRVVLTWEAAYGKDFQIQVSNDASNWTTLTTVSGNTNLTSDLSGLSGTGRYVRMLGIKRATSYGYSLWEMEVYGV